MDLRQATVLITRPRHQAEELSRLLTAHGAIPQLFPTISIVPTPPEVISETLNTIDTFDWVVFTSANGVIATLEAMKTVGIPVSRFDHCKIAAVGEKTAKTAEDLIRKPDVVPPRYLAEELPAAMHTRSTDRVLLCRADIGTPELVAALREQVLDVVDCSVYSITEGASAEDCAKAETLPQPKVIVFTSPSTVRGFLSSVPAALRERWLSEAVLASIGSVTTEELIRTVRSPEVEASPSTVTALVQGLIEYRRKNN